MRITNNPELTALIKDIKKDGKIDSSDIQNLNKIKELIKSNEGLDNDKKEILNTLLVANDNTSKIDINYSESEPVSALVNGILKKDVLKQGSDEKAKYEIKIFATDKKDLDGFRNILKEIKSDKNISIKQKKELANHIKETITNERTSNKDSIFEKLSLETDDILNNVPENYRKAVTPVGQTAKTKANVFIHDDTKNKNGEKWTDYLCGHVFRTTSESMGTSNVKYSGFIHMGEGYIGIEGSTDDPVKDKKHKEQYLEVLGTGIKGFADKLKDKSNITIMVTGFTQFSYIKDNPTSRFLFGDGKSTEPSSFGFKRPTNDIDKMMENTFGKFKEAPKPFYIKQGDKQIEAGRTYTFTDPISKETKTINLSTVRLPVDTDFTNNDNQNNNLIGDGTGNTLKTAIAQAKPDAIISFGAGTPGNNNFFIETNSYGAKGKTSETSGNGLKGNAEYKNKENYSNNNSLPEIYKTQIK